MRGSRNNGRQTICSRYTVFDTSGVTFGSVTFSGVTFRGVTVAIGLSCQQ